MNEVSANIAHDYYRHIRSKKQALFDLYRDERLERKTVARGNGWTWGYRLMVNDTVATGSSIGEDEIKLFFDIPLIIEARYSYCIGVAFGLSMFNLALAKPDHIVFGIDNYAERAGPATDHARSLVERTIRNSTGNVRLYVGSSPGDTSACLASLPRDEKLSIVFIDALHRNEAAGADFDGTKPFIDRRSVVLWHNVNSVAAAFDAKYDPSMFDRKLVLRTYGVMGVYFNASVHPELDNYFRDNCLVWDNWTENLAILAGSGRKPAQGTGILSRLFGAVRSIAAGPARNTSPKQ